EPHRPRGVLGARAGEVRGQQLAAGTGGGGGVERCVERGELTHRPAPARRRAPIPVAPTRSCPRLRVRRGRAVRGAPTRPRPVDPDRPRPLDRRRPASGMPDRRHPPEPHRSAPGVPDRARAVDRCRPRRVRPPRQVPRPRPRSVHRSPASRRGVHRGRVRTDAGRDSRPVRG
ncbi:MAG: hypothetical protein ACK56I_14710, partial [bacterium]